jgi:hypothetical protein
MDLSKHEFHKQVPTWNYMVARLRTNYHPRRRALRARRDGPLDPPLSTCEISAEYSMGYEWPSLVPRGLAPRMANKINEFRFSMLTGMVA